MSYRRPYVQICRICLIKGSGFPKIHTGSAALLNGFSIYHVLHTLLPDLNLSHPANPVICKQCLGQLEITYTFRTKCLTTEYNINRYLEDTNRKDGWMTLDLFEVADYMKGRDMYICTAGNDNLNGERIRNISEPNDSLMSDKFDVEKSVLAYEIFNSDKLKTKINDFPLQAKKDVISTSNSTIQVDTNPKLATVSTIGSTSSSTIQVGTIPKAPSTIIGSTSSSTIQVGTIPKAPSTIIGSTSSSTIQVGTNPKAPSTIIGSTSSSTIQVGTIPKAPSTIIGSTSSSTIQVGTIPKAPSTIIIDPVSTSTSAIQVGTTPKQLIMSTIKKHPEKFVKLKKADLKKLKLVERPTRLLQNVQTGSPKYFYCKLNKKVVVAKNAHKTPKTDGNKPQGLALVPLKKFDTIKKKFETIKTLQKIYTTSLAKHMGTSESDTEQLVITENSPTSNSSDVIAVEPSSNELITSLVPIDENIKAYHPFETKYEDLIINDIQEDECFGEAPRNFEYDFLPSANDDSTIDDIEIKEEPLEYYPTETIYSDGETTVTASEGSGNERSVSDEGLDGLLRELPGDKEVDMEFDKPDYVLLKDIGKKLPDDSTTEKKLRNHQEPPPFLYPRLSYVPIHYSQDLIYSRNIFFKSKFSKHGDFIDDHDYLSSAYARYRLFNVIKWKLDGSLTSWKCYCMICGEYQNTQDHQKHMEQHSSMCEICDIDFKSAYALNVHLRSLNHNIYCHLCKENVAYKDRIHFELKHNVSGLKDLKDQVFYFDEAIGRFPTDCAPPKIQKKSSKKRPKRNKISMKTKNKSKVKSKDSSVKVEGITKKRRRRIKENNNKNGEDSKPLLRRSLRNIKKGTKI